MSLRDHIPHHHHEEEEAPATTADPGDQPIPGYDSFTIEQLRVEFHKHTQAELDACEAYERSHANRKDVLDKLRYMHSRQPWQGYDDMDEGEILARLENADDNTIKRVRDYERKFGNRPHIHDAAMRLHRQRVEEAPPEKPPAYRAGGGSFDNL